MTPKSPRRRTRDRAEKNVRAVSGVIGQAAVEAEALAGIGKRTTAALETLSTTVTPETWAAAGLGAPEALARQRMLDMRVAAGAVRDGAGRAARPEEPLDLGRLTPSDLAFLARDWPLLARPEQLPPDGDWRNWLILGGRGSGKTRAGAEWVQARVMAAGKRTDLRIALVAETLGDAREVMIDGASGLARIARRMRPEVEISRRRLVWPNGAIAQIFSSEDPESLRGPQFHLAWCDELAKWKHADET
ncbi:MAG: terminase large subunit domain-containing protein, partial [Allorhizobium sp.]